MLVQLNVFAHAEDYDTQKLAGKFTETPLFLEWLYVKSTLNLLSGKSLDFFLSKYKTVVRNSENKSAFV